MSPWLYEGVGKKHDWGVWLSLFLSNSTAPLPRLQLLLHPFVSPMQSQTFTHSLYPHSPDPDLIMADRLHSKAIKLLTQLS